MIRRRTFSTSRFPCLLGLVLAIGALAQSPNAASQETEPFHRLREQTADFVGPAGESVAVSEIDEVLIGYFGPSDGQDPATDLMWQAAQVAIDQANQEGGLSGKPFRLVPAWSADPWGTGAAKLAQLVYRDKVWAIVGGIDGPSTHLAEQIVAKARLPLISPVSTDKTSNLANVPWLFSLAPGDHLIAPLLAAEIDRRVGTADWGIISSDQHDSRKLASELKKAVKGSPRFQFVYRHAEPKFTTLVRRVLDQNPAAVLVLADVGDTAQLVRQLRAAEYPGELFGGPCLGRRQFVRLAGEAAEGSVFPSLTQRDGLRSTQTAKEPIASVVRGAKSWDYAADLTYDAVTLTIQAVRRAGLNRAGIRKAIRELAPWQGIAGAVRWDPLGSNTRHARLATIVDGRVRPLGASNQSLP